MKYLIVILILICSLLTCQNANSEYILKSVDDLETYPLWSYDNGFGICVFSSKDYIETDKYAKQLVDKGYMPVRVEQHDNWYKVLLGEFPIHAEALWIKNELRKKSIFPDCYIILLKSLNKPVEITQYSGPEPNVIQIPTNGFAFTLNEDSMDDKITTEMLYMYYTKDFSTSFTLEIEKIVAGGNWSDWNSYALKTSSDLDEMSLLIDNLPTTNPLKANLALSLVEGLTIRKRCVEPHIHLLDEILSGNWRSLEEDFIEAALLKAMLIHQFKKERVKAYAIYTTLPLIFPDMPMGKKARCWAERCALTRELVACDSGKYCDIMRLRKQMRQEIPLSFMKAHAVADIVAIENYWSDSTNALQDLEKKRNTQRMLKQFYNYYDNNCPREQIFALTLKSSMDRRLDDKEELYWSTQQVLRLSPLPEEELSYYGNKWFDQAIMILNSTAYYLKKKGDYRDLLEQVERHLSYLKEKRKDLPFRINMNKNLERQIGTYRKLLIK